MSGSWGEISETLKRRCFDICYLEEVRWKGEGAKMVGNFFEVRVVKQKTVLV